VALAGCGAATANHRGAFQWTPDVKPGVYFPLAVGTAWSYDVTDDATGEKILLVNRVDTREGPRATLFTGADPLIYEDQGDSLVRMPSGTIALKTPIQAGTTWEIPGGKAMILAINARVDAIAGSYGSCVSVEETNEERRVVTTYAPNVGPVEVKVFARGPAGERLDRRGILRSFHAAGDPVLQ
jgi:hypothetical protein